MTKRAEILQSILDAELLLLFLSNIYIHTELLSFPLQLFEWISSNLWMIKLSYITLCQKFLHNLLKIWHVREKKNKSKKIIIYHHISLKILCFWIISHIIGIERERRERMMESQMFTFHNVSLKILYFWIISHFYDH